MILSSPAKFMQMLTLTINKIWYFLNISVTFNCHFKLKTENWKLNIDTGNVFGTGTDTFYV